MSEYQIRQLADELQPPESGTQSLVLLGDRWLHSLVVASLSGFSSATVMGPAGSDTDSCRPELSERLIISPH